MYINVIVLLSQEFIWLYYMYVSSADKGEGGGGTNYWGLAFREEGRGPKILLVLLTCIARTN